LQKKKEQEESDKQRIQHSENLYLGKTATGKKFTKNPVPRNEPVWKSAND